jgi:hypothetical protein
MIKVLFATFDGADYLASCLWNGLVEVLGWDNVYDAGRNKEFARTGTYLESSQNIVGWYRCKRLSDTNDSDFDLLVVNACFLRQENWRKVGQIRERLRPGGKVAYIEGWDDARDYNDPQAPHDHLTGMVLPALNPDAVFRREIEPGFAYPYLPISLDFAAPQRWFEETLTSPKERDIDVYFSGQLHTHPARRAGILDTIQRNVGHFVFSSGKIPLAQHFEHLRRSKFALCPPGAAGCNCLRTYEAIACGAIPIMLGHPPRIRDPWLPSTTFVDCPNGHLPDNLDYMVSQDWPDARRLLLEYGMEHHTTRARAVKLLKEVGIGV